MKDAEPLADQVLPDSTHGNQKQMEALPEIHFPLDSLLAFNSEAQMKKVFGEYVTHSTGHYPEGMGEYENTLLFPGTENEAEFVWADDSLNFSGLAHVRIEGERTAWKTKEGITLGTTLKTLEQLNKKSFLFFGFGWDYAGAVNWNEGSLAHGALMVYLDFPGDTIPPEYDSLLGDRQISSDMELAQKANPVVREIVLRPVILKKDAEGS